MSNMQSTAPHVLGITHSVDAAELQRGEGNDDGEELPANWLVPDELHHRVAANFLNRGVLLQHLLHVHTVVLVPPEPP